MVNAIFIQNPQSIYDDQPGEAYHFPRQYLGTVQQTIGDWVIFYESRRGAFGYVSVQKVKDVVPDPKNEGHYYALLDRGSRWQFERVVRRADPNGIAYEKSLRKSDGSPMSGGASVSAVRKLSPSEFASILDAGLTELEGADVIPRVDLQSPMSGLAENHAPFLGLQPVEDRSKILTSRPARDASFQRLVKAAYKGRCAISGLQLRNGGGRPEVQAAHIRAVADDGPDVVQNGLALSGTLHWMFDRGLISVADDLSILISHNKVPGDVAARLITPGQKLLLPDNARDHSHPDYLKFHRENTFGQGETM
ncbi:HNH endonuclease [Neptunicoccus cionae]|uniref:HNH endonuclease n=1 Tax=Neptunicoccus cionae TaxID=2035344 RepID=UPI000C77801F|nr:HNH endonuclease [Amylibacter cionae]PLS21902.1 HNH endonuclease [Amylibacter cionae]